MTVLQLLHPAIFDKIVEGVETECIELEAFKAILLKHGYSKTNLDTYDLAIWQSIANTNEIGKHYIQIPILISILEQSGMKENRPVA